MVDDGFLFVSPSGDDKAPGTFMEPIRSMKEAVKRIRSVDRAGMKADLVVYLRGGEYYLENPITFTGEDSGADGHRIVYRAYPGETPELVGGEPLSGWETAGTVEGRTIFRTKIRDNWEFNTLYEDGVRVRKARTPDTGFLTTEASAHEGSMIRFVYREGDLPEFDIKRTQVLIWEGSIGTLQNNWKAEISTVLSLDRDQRMIRLSSRTWWPITAGNRYFVQGAREFLNAPGEYYIDRKEDALYYIPLTGTLEGKRIIAPRMTSILRFAGDTFADPVHDISIEGLHLTMTDFDEEFTGGSMRMEEGTVFLQNAESIAIQGCRISNSGFHAVSLRHAAKDNLISGNLLEHMGLGGVNISTDYQTILSQGHKTWEEGWISRGNRIENNLIRFSGEMAGGEGTGIQINTSGENLVRNNTIHDMTRAGVIIGDESYGFFKKLGSLFGEAITYENHASLNYSQGNRIEDNDIFRIMTDSSDCGAIYSFGGGEGCVISGNFIHDFAALKEGITVGLYLDDSADGFLVKDNIVSRVGNGGLLGAAIMIKGAGSTVENNLFVDVNLKSLFETMESGLDAYAGGNAPDKPEPTEDIVFRRNVFSADFVPNYGPKAAVFYNYKANTFRIFEDNLFYLNGLADEQYLIHGNALDQPSWKNYRTFSFRSWHEEFGKGFNLNSVVGQDPLIMDPDKDDYRLKEGSPALRIGFEPLDASHAGITKDYPFPAEATADDRTP